jgi:hypothetical protein
MSEQQENLDRVSERIGPAVMAFSALVLGKDFFADDLRRYVGEQVGVVAPGSPDRILRQLRQKRRLGYKVISRSESIYRMLWVGEEPIVAM